jgi:mRNA-degrading endonuclease toxin of MazEF toxin-antitoxin module
MCVVVSDDVLMAKAELAIVVPITSHEPRGVRAHVPLDPARDRIDSGPLRGSVLCDQIRAVSTTKYDETTNEGRFRRYAGTLSRGTMQKIESELAALLNL